MGSIAQTEEKKEKENKSNKTAQVQQTVQRDLSDVNGPEGGMLPNDVSAKIQSMRGSGQKLSDKQNQYFSQKFGCDMSDVHVHTDAASDTISRSLNARAFTIGSDVFLTKGVNPDGGGSSMQTMTHELTHVVQQGGHASSGPLKLGAADTAQEHEAESTAQREFDPKLKEDETVQRESAAKSGKSETIQRQFEPQQAEQDTIQRGFWSDLGSALGGAALNAIGLGEAMGDFMGGSNKVKTAIAKMPDNTKSEYQEVEKNIKQSEDEIPGMERNVNKLQKRIDTMDGDPYMVDEKDRLLEDLKPKRKDLNDRKAALDASLKQQLSMLKAVDATITADDVNRYRSGKAKTFFSSVFSAIGGKILGAFASDPEQKAAAQAKGRNSINNWFASKNKASLNTEGSEEEQAQKAEELKTKQKNLVDGIWTAVQNDKELKIHYTRLLFNREIASKHMSMIQEELQNGENESEIRDSVLMLMRNNVQSSSAGAGAQAKQAA